VKGFVHSSAILSVMCIGLPPGNPRPSNRPTTARKTVRLRMLVVRATCCSSGSWPARMFRIGDNVCGALLLAALLRGRCRHIHRIGKRIVKLGIFDLLASTDFLLLLNGSHCEASLNLWMTRKQSRFPLILSVAIIRVVGDGFLDLFLRGKAQKAPSQRQNAGFRLNLRIPHEIVSSSPQQQNVDRQCQTCVSRT